MKTYIQATYLTGPQASQMLTFDGDKVVFSDQRMLKFSQEGGKFFLTITKEDPIFINNREAYGYIEVRNNDVIRLDDNTHNVLIRFKQTRKQTKTPYEISKDAKELAKSSKHPTTLMLIPYLLQQFFKHSTWIFRIVIIIIIIGLLVIISNLQGLIQQNTTVIADTKSHLEETLEEFSSSVNTETSSENDTPSEIKNIYKSVGVIGISHILIDRQGNTPTYYDILQICDADEYSDYSDWRTEDHLVFEKYGYSFKYPPDCFYGPMPGDCKQKPPEECK